MFSKNTDVTRSIFRRAGLAAVALAACGTLAVGCSKDNPQARAERVKKEQLAKSALLEHEGRTLVEEARLMSLGGQALIEKGDSPAGTAAIQRAEVKRTTGDNKLVEADRIRSAVASTYGD